MTLLKLFCCYLEIMKISLSSYFFRLPYSTYPTTMVFSDYFKLLSFYIQLFRLRYIPGNKFLLHLNFPSKSLHFVKI